MASPVRVIDHDTFYVSPNDKTRKYRHITIEENQIQCLLISDSTTDKSAACCDVHVGSMADPPEAQGLAHFLEHMLFMGTETYPDENAYQAYLSSHGGSSNAYTDQENTVYYFDVQPDYFEGALDIFASFFVCPLFNESSTMREINAVDSENSKNLQSDMWRSWQLFKSMAKSTHPFSNFSTGNLQTLKESTEAKGLNIRDLLLSFYAEYYSSNLMKVCVYGKEDLDTLQSFVVRMFSKVPNKNLSRPAVPSDPFGVDELGKIVRMIPIRDSKTLELAFPFPSIEKYYKSKPGKYLSHLIGHESEGSILSALKAKSWANSLSSGVSQSYKDFAFLNVDIELSEEGSSHIDEIISCVFSYVAMLKRQGVELWIAKEIKELKDLNYRFLEKTQPTNYVMKMANGMQTYAPETIVSSPYVIETIDISMIPELLSLIRPDNMLVLYKNKSLTTSKKEKWYGTDYEDIKFSSDQLNRWKLESDESSSVWSDVLYLPKPNPFIPEDFNIRGEKSNSQSSLQLLSRVALGIVKDESVFSNDVSVDPAIPDSNVEEDGGDDADDEGDNNVSSTSVSSQPMQLYSGKLVQSWFKQDTVWKVPLMNVVVILETNMSSNSPVAVAMTDLLIQVLKELLNEFAYYADCAGLHYDIQLAKGGIEILCYGYQDKLSILVLQTLTELKHLVKTVPEKLATFRMIFQRMKEKVLRTYYNSLFWQPYYHAILGTALCLEDPRFTSADKHRALFSVEYEDFQSFCRFFVQTLKVEVFMHGNATVDEAKDLSTKIVDCIGHLPLARCQDPIRRFVDLPLGKSYVYRQHAKHFNPAEVNSSLEVLFLAGSVTGAGLQSVEQSIHEERIHVESILHLLVQMMSDKAFDQLRTKEQLGYIVFTGLKKLGQQVGLHLVVQSNHKDPEYLDGRVDAFISSFLDEFTNESSPTYIDDKALAEFKQATIEKLLEQPKNMNEETQQLMEEIRQNTYLFDRKETLATRLKAIAETELRQIVIAFLHKYILDANTVCKFKSMFYGSKHSYTKIENSADITIIRDPVVFKQSMKLLPYTSYEEAYQPINAE